MKPTAKRIEAAKDLVKIAKEIIAVPLIDEYNDCKIYLNGMDHRPPHLAVWSGNPSQKADVAITNGKNDSYADGQIIHLGSFPRNKIDDLKHWFSPENRENRIEKIMDYVLERGEPSWFNLDEIFTEQEMNEYRKRKSEKMAFDISEIQKNVNLDVNKPWSSENDFDDLIQIEKCTFNDDYSIDLKFADGKSKRFDCKDKIFNERNRDYRWFKKLQDINKFKKGKCYGWIVIWSDEIDISSFELYTKSE